jgi:hypothetical protein
VRRTAVCLKWMKPASDTYCKYEVLIVWSFDSVCHLTVTCILKTKCHRTYDAQNVLLAFCTKESHHRELVREFCVILYTYVTSA